jgi:hypothetical protein
MPERTHVRGVYGLHGGHTWEDAVTLAGYRARYPWTTAESWGTRYPHCSCGLFADKCPDLAAKERANA